MARFFFDVHDRWDIADDVGQELAGPLAVRRQALRYAGALIGELDGEEEDWRMDVRDEQGRVLFSVAVTISDRAGLGGRDPRFDRYAAPRLSVASTAP